MREHELKLLLENSELLTEKIDLFLSQGFLNVKESSEEEVAGHLLKAEHDLMFAAKNIEMGFYDWVISGCYYACYHAALALILTRNYFSKNHLATLCILIKEFYNKEINKEDIGLLARMLDYEDVQFYVESKNRREDATYSTSLIFDRKETELLRIKAALFVSKIKGLINS